MTSPPSAGRSASEKRVVPRLFAEVLAPFQSFFRMEASGGILLAVAAVVAIVWANSPGSERYLALTHYPLGLSVGGTNFTFTLHDFVNDFLMAIFFFLVGMEIKRELAVGELSTPAKAMLPLIAAAGGMVIPAAVYLFFTIGTPAQGGWGIPMATDIAFAIGCLSLVRSRVPNALIVFLTALAIFDDLGGILVIAIFYGSGIDLQWLAAAGAITLLLFGFNRLYVRTTLLWVLGGAALWYAVHHSGIHATIAGVILGMMIPVRGRRPPREVLEQLEKHVEEGLNSRSEAELDNQRILQIEETLEDLEPPLNRYVHFLHPYVAFGIVPLFALLNAGVDMRAMSFGDLFAAIPLGTALGLFLGKQLGIFGATWLAVKLKVSPMPGGAPLMQLYGVAVVGGIGFTVALFIAELAFPGMPTTLEQAKLGIIVGSFLAAVVGYLVLRFSKPAAVLPPSPPREKLTAA